MKKRWSIPAAPSPEVFAQIHWDRWSVEQNTIKLKRTQWGSIRRAFKQGWAVQIGGWTYYDRKTWENERANKRQWVPKIGRSPVFRVPTSQTLERLFELALAPSPALYFEGSPHKYAEQIRALLREGRAVVVFDEEKNRYLWRCPQDFEDWARYQGGKAKLEHK